MSSLPFAELAVRSSFARDQRFACGPRASPPVAEDPVALAYAEGFAQGAAEACTQAELRTQNNAAALAAIELSLARLDADLAEELRQRLYATVEALCEAALAPYALDTDALARRVERAAALLARADDERVLRLNPDDAALIAARLPADLAVQSDPALPRGALRIEGGAGGIEDGPDQWRRAIAEALEQC